MAEEKALGTLRLGPEVEELREVTKGCRWESQGSRVRVG